VGNDEALHLVQQYVASLIDMACSVAHPATPRASKVSLLPHPETGLSHLSDWLGDQLYPAPNRALDFVIRPEVAASHFPDAVRERAKQLDADTEKRAICGITLQEQVATLISAMLSRTAPDLDRVAAAAGISGRTLRRALQQDRIRYSDLVDRTRAQIGLDRIRMDTDVPLKSIAKDLGYAHQATLSRAIRRWTGEAPSNLQKHGRDAHDGG
jgi:AraC-like DNA-binding protein